MPSQITSFPRWRYVCMKVGPPSVMTMWWWNDPNVNTSPGSVCNTCHLVSGLNPFPRRAALYKWWPKLLQQEGSVKNQVFTPAHMTTVEETKVECRGAENRGPVKLL